MSHAWRIALVIGIAVIASIGGYLYRDLVVEGLRCIALVIALLPFIWLMYELCLALFRFWPVRKLWEGAGLIARALDRIPGVVYVIVLALGVCDVFQWLPFGLRDIAAWLPQRERRVETPSDFERPTPKMKDGLFVASPTTLAPMPSEGHTAPSIPTPEIPPLSTKPRTASGKEGGTPQVLEFHVPGYGNATEHVTVRGPFQAGDVVPATWRGQPIWLRVKRPLPDSLYGQGVSRWLAVPVDLQGEPIVAAP